MEKNIFNFSSVNELLRLPTGTGVIGCDSVAVILLIACGNKDMILVEKRPASSIVRKKINEINGDINKTKTHPQLKTVEDLLNVTLTKEVGVKLLKFRKVTEIDSTEVKDTKMLGRIHTKKIFLIPEDAIDKSQLNINKFSFYPIENLLANSATDNHHRIWLWKYCEIKKIKSAA